MVGKNKGDEAEAVFDVEPDHQQREYAGKKLKYVMKVESVSEFILPELNEDFYKKLFGDETDVHTEEDFRNKMRTQLVETTEKDVSDDAEYRALMEVVKQSKLEVPETLIRRQVQVLRQRDEESARERLGMELSDVLSRSDNANWEKNYLAVLRIRAEAMLRQSLVVDAISEKYEVEVEKEDMDAELTRRAGRYNVDKNTLAGIYYKNQEAMDKMVDDVRYNKTTALLLTKVKVKEVDELTPALQPEQQPQPEQSEQGGQE